MTENHVEIAKLLIGLGAVVDDSVLRDHTIEMEGGTADFALRNVLEAAWSAANGTAWSWSENK
jgi:hypothetical protein